MPHALIVTAQQACRHGTCCGGSADAQPTLDECACSIPMSARSRRFGATYRLFRRPAWDPAPPLRRTCSIRDLPGYRGPGEGALVSLGFGDREDSADEQRPLRFEAVRRRPAAAPVAMQSSGRDRSVAPPEASGSAPSLVCRRRWIPLRELSLHSHRRNCSSPFERSHRLKRGDPTASHLTRYLVCSCRKGSTGTIMNFPSNFLS